MDNLKRPRSEDDDGRDYKHIRRAKLIDNPGNPTFNDLRENSSPYDSIRKWIHDVQISDTADMANINPEEAPADLHEDLVIEQLETSSTIQETLSPSGSPIKRKFGFASQNGLPLASDGNIGARRLVKPVSKLVSTKQLSSRNSSLEKLSTRSQSVSARTTVSQVSTSIPMRRAGLAKYSPAFVFSHTHDLASGSIPRTVLDFKKLVLSESLPKGILPLSSRESLVTKFPDTEFPTSLFSDSPKYGIDLINHVTFYYENGLRNYSDDATESVLSHMAKALLEGLPKGRPGPLQVAGIEQQLAPLYTTDEDAPDIIIHGSNLYDSKFRQLRRQVRYPPAEIDETFSPFIHPSLRNAPAFAAIEVKAGTGCIQEAQMQAGVIGGAILLKARQIGASAEAVPCVPVVIVSGFIWCLHLVYDEPDLIIISTPWVIGDTVTFLGTLKVVLFIEQLRSYAKDTWWKLFVDGSCSDLLERCLGV
ncbi:uncharacterized protein DFL_000008 [Arthrobotrys flagrans]|uniref:PD-(D/E)XK nuclease-like domain-containing protein n=1 Tax=Arthrobotrys flagrans TaxID=97331 RepID=A0A437ACL4_ARTFL|nr:hypothetical protein DFL_000008 [Arthrobotrys flagrans]